MMKMRRASSRFPAVESNEMDTDEITAKLVFYNPIELEPHIRHSFYEGALLRELNAQAIPPVNFYPYKI